MTETIGPVPDRIDQQQLAQQLIDAARPLGLANGWRKGRGANCGCVVRAVRFSRHAD